MVVRGLNRSGKGHPKTLAHEHDIPRTKDGDSDGERDCYDESAAGNLDLAATAPSLCSH